MPGPTTNDPLSKPIVMTIVVILIAIPLQPIPGIDALYDLAAVLFVGSKWFRYLLAAQQIASTVSPVKEPPDAGALLNEGMTAFNEKKYVTALRLYKLSAAAGNSGAMNNIGAMFQNGNGIAVSYPLAAKWYEKAVAKGERKYAPSNLELLGTVYYEGKKTAANPAEAARIWRIAADTGLAAAQCDLGMLYLGGVGVPRDKNLARHWYGLAAAQGYMTAKDALRRLDAEQQGEQDQSAGSRNTKMTRATALELLELEEGATKADMKKAYMRLMQNVHPDKGGSNYFAKQLNEAREVLEF